MTFKGYATSNALLENIIRELSLIIGEDNLSIFNKWKDYEYLLSNFRIFVYPRPNTGEYDLPIGKDITIFKGAPQFDISSTQIRNLNNQ